jgi:hypothetical protein
MTLMATFALSAEVEGRAHYSEIPGVDTPAIVGSLSIDSQALPRPTPPLMRISLYFYDELATPARADTLGAAPARAVLKADDEVTIVKNSLAGIRYPPEWLEQYLGRTGRVLWTTADGAMVRLDTTATWFPYAELEATS